MASIDNVDENAKKEFLYAIVEKWWNSHGSYPPKPEYLPDNINDWLFVVENDTRAAAGFMYQSNSKICIFEFVVCNPALDKETRDKALDKLIKLSIDWKEKNNYGLIYSSIGINKYIKRLEDNGFVKVDTGQTHMFYES